MANNIAGLYTINFLLSVLSAIPWKHHLFIAYGTMHTQQWTHDIPGIALKTDNKSLLHVAFLARSLDNLSITWVIQIGLKYMYMSKINNNWAHKKTGHCHKRKMMYHYFIIFAQIWRGSSSTTKYMYNKGVGAGVESYKTCIHNLRGYIMIWRLTTIRSTTETTWSDYECTAPQM